jgi:hypothetical protein
MDVLFAIFSIVVQLNHNYNWCATIKPKFKMWWNIVCSMGLEVITTLQIKLAFVLTFNQTCAHKIYYLNVWSIFQGFFKKFNLSLIITWAKDSNKHCLTIQWEVFLPLLMIALSIWIV